MMAVLGFLLVVTCATLDAQSPNPLSFFPHHTGDVWEYQEYRDGLPMGTSQRLVTTDSLGADGKYYVVVKSIIPGSTYTTAYVVDTTNLEVMSNSRGLQLRYKLDADSGQSWVTQRTEWNVFQAKVTHVSYTQLFDSSIVMIKAIDYVDSATGLLIDTDYLASGFGLVGYDVDAFVVRRIRGAIIGGKQYGTVTSVTPEPTGLGPMSVDLLQNYPNPFNPSTTISYKLPASELVTLRVFDILGREVVTLVREQQGPGSHEVQFNAVGLPTGIYFDRLETPRGTITKRMVLVR